MSAEDLRLLKRFFHWEYDMYQNSYVSYAFWYPACKSFEECWNCNIKRCYEKIAFIGWEKICKNRGLVEFAPYTSAAIDLKLTIYGY